MPDIHINNTLIKHSCFFIYKFFFTIIIQFTYNYLHDTNLFTNTILCNIRSRRKEKTHSTSYPESDFVKSNVAISSTTMFHIVAVLNNIISFWNFLR